MHSFFLAFVVFVLFRLEAEFKLFKRFEHVSVFFNLGMEHLDGVELKFKLEMLFELPQLDDGDVSILIVCG